jgi:hypothetical protein
MPKRHENLRSLILATGLALVSVLGAVATALADGGGSTFPK